MARQVIERAGYARFILHHAGHQIGRENLELPAFVPHSKDILEEGMVTTVEIGIYVPDIGGVRIEEKYDLDNLLFLWYVYNGGDC